MEWPRTALYTKKIPDTPSRLRAVTKNPDTAPPRNATVMASFSEFWAAEAVRRLARTAMYMPTNPETEEQRAPSRNAMAVRTPSVEWPEKTATIPPMMTAVTIARIEIVRYWRARK